METYCVKCRRDTENIDPKMVRIKNDKLVMQSKCPVWGIKSQDLQKDKKQKQILLSNLGIKTLLIKIPLLNGLC